ncbi:MAG: regulatory protein RecX [Gammaproteobacteria bacterium]|jgi:regulatory protein|nr:regulatory protein RecX [Gammaproteobacteria bacterium]MCZ6579838.1 regulatory protein RecX [Gammaproteobacteria bacterium]MCZ6883723.1 regulatory protein RecX [Gammaproteobacteria bacterium]
MRTKDKTTRSIRVVAMDLLARREHSVYELTRKLKQRDFENDEIDAAIAALQQDNLQSDSRFIESIVNYRINAGFGPIKIRYELRQKGVSEGLVDDYFSGLDIDWQSSMAGQRIKKFGDSLPVDYKEKMKQARFLQNRGFSPESVMRLFR